LATLCDPLLSVSFHRCHPSGALGRTPGVLLPVLVTPLSDHSRGLGVHVGCTADVPLSLPTPRPVRRRWLSFGLLHHGRWTTLTRIIRLHVARHGRKEKKTRPKKRGLLRSFYFPLFKKTPLMMAKGGSGEKSHEVP